MVAYQLMLPVRYVRVAATAVTAASQSFVLFDTASNTPAGQQPAGAGCPGRRSVQCAATAKGDHLPRDE